MKFVIETIFEYKLVSAMFIFIFLWFLRMLIKTIIERKKMSEEQKAKEKSGVGGIILILLGVLGTMVFMASLIKKKYDFHWAGEVVEKKSYWEKIENSRRGSSRTVYRVTLKNGDWYEVSEKNYDKIKIHDYVAKEKGSYDIVIKNKK